MGWGGRTRRTGGGGGRRGRNFRLDVGVKTAGPETMADYISYEGFRHSWKYCILAEKGPPGYVFREKYLRSVPYTITPSPPLKNPIL